MQKPGKARIVVLVALLVLISLAVVLTVTRRQGTNSPPPGQVGVAVPVQPPARPEPAVRVHAATPPAEMPGEDTRNANPLHLSREKIEEYLALHHRDAASLLAAHRALFDAEHNQSEVDYLREAATNFPNDPRVQLAVLAQDAFPENRRQWLDAFKASSPSNSLANYLSAREYFKDNQTQAAIQELMEASGKAQFTDYSMETFLGTEELFRSSGASSRISATAAMSAMAQDMLPQLSGMKGIINGVTDLQKQYTSAGDAASVQHLAQLGIGLANRLNQGDGGRFLISQLVGMAIENVALKSLDPNTAYDFLGGLTPAQRMDALKAQKQSFRELQMVGSGIGALNLSDNEMIAYIERVKVYGELPAMRWLKQQHPEVSTPPAR